MIITLILILFNTLILIFNVEAISSARHGLEIWLINVVPSLFPFMVVTNIILKRLPKLSEKSSKFLAFTVGFTAGAPLSTKIIGDLLRENKLTKIEAQKLLSSCTNMGMIFILGTVTSITGDFPLSKKILAVHYFSAILTFFLFKFYKSSYKEEIALEKKEIKFKKENFSTIFKDSIANSVKTTLAIGGYIIFFSVIIRFLELSRVAHYISQIINFEDAIPLIYGLFEVTTALSYTNSPMVIATIMSFTGISIISQSISFLDKSGLNLKVFIASKFIHAAITFLISYLVF